MTDLTERRPLQPSLIEIAFVWFQRLVACVCLAFGLLYWVRLIGVYDEQLWRFDLMPVQWQISSVILAVCYPFVAIGLWMLASWAPVIWVICAVTETAMYFAYPDIHGHRFIIVAGNIGVALVYAIFRVLIQRQWRVAEQHG